MAVFDWLFDPSGLTPHGFCLTWQPGLIALHAGSDALVGLSYLSIPIAIASFVRQRRDLRYGWLAYPFMGFILACGVTHLLAVLTLWVPAYGIEGLVKALTAVLSMATAILLWPLIPQLVALPSPAQLVLLNGKLRESETRVRATNLELERRVAERTADLLDANRNLTEAVADRDVALRALARSEAEFRASFEGAGVGKVQAEPTSRRILRVNQAFARMLGYDADDLVGRTTLDLTFPDDNAVDAVTYARLMDRTTDTHVNEKRYVRKDGTIFWVRVSATLVNVPGGDHPLIVIAVVEDIDARHRAEAALYATTENLKLVVEERTEALDQRDLLLREVYHRVKNNLQIVDSLLAMQARDWGEGDGKRALTNLRGRIHALGLVHHQLMGSKDLKTFDIAPFLSELSTHIVDGGPARDVSVSVDACELYVGLDFSIPLGLLVTELVTNSIKHAFADQKGAISVVLRRSPDNTLLLIVSDDGSMAVADDRTLGLNSGLGHRIVSRLVRQLEGTMSVSTSRGTTTEIRLPMPVVS